MPYCSKVNPVDLMTSPQLRWSRWTFWANSTALKVLGAMSSRIMTSRTLLDFIADCKNRFHRSTSAGGVPLGAKKPYQSDACSISFRPRPASENVGTAGNKDDRLSPVTANTRIRPALACSKVMPPVSMNADCVSPATTACMAGAPPL